ncbi:hypothetical protein [Massilia sp. Se16.2.3]|uniref:hypothetical protein n=1 Tax=Massilia sp. Se16.2.3 TaxID=2709303 RepID=UPI0016042EAA|nr:hypothetical protein [Massilia sp. Se16.2.3]QNA99550.1 hypothetical protein G4G31_13110 [Massilia sp. Se16.2.3]
MRRAADRVAAAGADLGRRAMALPAAIARMLALVVSLLHGLLRTDWLKYVGTPAMQSGLFLLIPAAWLLIWENFLARRRGHAQPVERRVGPRRERRAPAGRGEGQGLEQRPEEHAA